MNYYEKRELKNYIYALKERNNRKDLIWEYLNEPFESEYFMDISIILASYIRSLNDKNSN